MTEQRNVPTDSLPDWDRRVRDALVAASDDVVVTDAGPQSSRIWDAVHGELSSREAQEVIDAALLDPEAFTELRLALAMKDELSMQDELADGQDAPAGGTVVRAVKPRRIPRAAWYAPLLAVAAAVIAVWALRPPPDPVDPSPAPYRDATPAAVRTALPADSPLPRAAFVLRWEAVDDGRYTVSVSTEAAKLITHVQGLRETSFHVPEASLADVPSGAKLLWRVEVVRPDGSRDKSATFVAVLE